ncbi:hypothetical protein LX73_2568 [Fodinibius salinus]|uniref:Uncharacterized protein n=1 Tax=Fodinibius salinus TaxID=860790 RepID=A0A5D3YEG2_9BACT|nr:hypothetical protein [Fodinibius salinus]TYP91741.1 hypothetical protein LX73_2568 [Fodinibius salinus]
MNNQKGSTDNQQRLQTIHQMITQAKGHIQNSSFYLLLWGWIVAAGSLGHYLLLEFSSIAHPEWAWSIVVVGIIASVVKGINDRRSSGIATYGEHLMTMIWVTFLINYFIILIFIAKINFYITPVILVLTAGSVFLSGILLKFKPLKWGAGFIWVMSIVAFMVPLPYQLLATTVAIGGGYLIPGYILKNNER